jgi:hypothetical protein
VVFVQRDGLYGVRWLDWDQSDFGFASDRRAVADDDLHANVQRGRGFLIERCYGHGVAADTGADADTDGDAQCGNGRWVLDAQLDYNQRNLLRCQRRLVGDEGNQW